MIQFLAQSSSTSSSGGLLSLLIPLLLMGGVFYFLLIRPQRTRARQQQSLLASLRIGDEVMTSAGIFGTIVDMDEESDTVTVEIAPGTNVHMLRRAVSQRFVEEDEDEQDVDDDGTEEEADSRP
ncbi:MAG TPA: preprotein translocase subunit YajC [Actinomycetota bacterium]|jgi:preprotein translocase subunit YajC|nr:preprotein translocase subunit YajC [Actinomycetota bacterium]